MQIYFSNRSILEKLDTLPTTVWLDNIAHRLYNKNAAIIYNDTRNNSLYLSPFPINVGICRTKENLNPAKCLLVQNTDGSGIRYDQPIVT